MKSSSKGWFFVFCLDFFSGGVICKSVTAIQPALFLFLRMGSGEESYRKMREKPNFAASTCRNEAARRKRWIGKRSWRSAGLRLR